MGRYVVLGAGAVGGAIGARLFEAGHEVLLVARGDHGRRIADEGLVLEMPERRVRLAVPAVAELAEGSVTEDDVVLLATKSQDTRGALEQLAAAGSPAVPVFCVQNGIANERAALRRFERVYGVLVVVPATHLEPGVVVLSSSGVLGILDLGRYPGGADEVAGEVSAALSAAGFRSRVLDDVMAWKRAKLLLNLGNALQALAGIGADTGDLAAAARDEARACFAAAGLAWTADEVFSARTGDLEIAPEGQAGRQGGSSWQSLARGLRSIEADFLNGEVVLLGRLHGVPTPVNALLQRLAGEQARGGSAPGSMPADRIRELLAAV